MPQHFPQDDCKVVHEGLPACRRVFAVAIDCWPGVGRSRPTERLGQTSSTHVSEIKPRRPAVGSVDGVQLKVVKEMHVRVEKHAQSLLVPVPNVVLKLLVCRVIRGVGLQAKHCCDLRSPAFFIKTPANSSKETRSFFLRNNQEFWGKKENQGFFVENSNHFVEDFEEFSKNSVIS